MTPLISFLARLGSTLHPTVILAWLIAINAQWVVTLQAFGAQFERSAGAPVLDLANVQGVLSPEAAQRLVQGYSEVGVALYWTFFAMDNVVPLLSFGSFALLWAMLLARSGLRLGHRLARSSLLLVPFAVGGLDIVENLFFVAAIASASSTEQLTLLAWGLGFTQAKAAAIGATMVGTIALLGMFAVGRWRVARTSAREVVAA